MAMKLLLIVALLATVPAPTPYERLGWCGRTVVDATNQLRREHGLRPLKVDFRLHRVARRLAVAMASSGTLHHNEEVLRAQPYSPVGENVGRAPDVATLNVAWSESPGHRANMLDPDYRFIGPGCAWGRGVWGDVIFGGPR